MTTLAEFHRAFAAFAAELEAHETVHRGAWRDQSVAMHLQHLADHCADARVRLAANPDNVEDIREGILHALSRAIMSAELYLREVDTMKEDT